MACCAVAVIGQVIVARSDAGGMRGFGMPTEDHPDNLMDYVKTGILLQWPDDVSPTFVPSACDPARAIESCLHSLVQRNDFIEETTNKGMHPLCKY